MNRQEELVAVGGPFDGQTLSIGKRDWDVNTWNPAPLSLSIYDIARPIDPVRDVLDAGTRTRYVRTRFSLARPSEYGESHGWAWVLIPEDNRPDDADGLALTEKVFAGLAMSFRGFAAEFETFADRSRALRHELARLTQDMIREADNRIMREMVYGTQRGTRLQGVGAALGPSATGIGVAALGALGLAGIPRDDDPILGGIARGTYPQRWATWRDFADDEPEPIDSSEDTWSAEYTADDCWRCDAARAASDIGLCDPCRDDLREPVPA